MALIPPSQIGVWGASLQTRSQASVYIYRAHLKLKDVKIPYKLFTKIIPPAIAMQKQRAAAGFMLHMEHFNIWRGLYPKCLSKAELTTGCITKTVY